MLDVSAGHQVFGNDSPVICKGFDGTPANVDHGLDGQHQAFFEPEILLAHVAADEIGDLRVLVHDAADAVADILLHHAEAGSFGMPLHTEGHLGPPAAAVHAVDGDLQDLVGGVHQAAAFRPDLADHNGDGRIRAPAVELAAAGASRPRPAPGVLRAGGAGVH